MSLLQKLKSVFGLDDDDGDEPTGDVGVTVEREPGETEPATETESAVKGADVEPTTGEQPERPAADPESADEAIEEAEPEREKDEEPAEEPEPETEAATTEPEAETEPEPETEEPEEPEEPEETEETEETEPETEEPEGSLEDIKGIGPAYAERLRNAGVESIADLAAADAEGLAEETDLSATRIENWIEQAKVR